MMEQLGPDTIQHIAGLVGVDLAAREKPPAPTEVRQQAFRTCQGSWVCM